MQIDVSKLAVEFRPTLVGVPDGVTVEYFGTMTNWPAPPGMRSAAPIQTRFAVLRPTDGWAYSDWVLLISRGGPFGAVPIREVRRYRDGGTTEIDTEHGTFGFPTPFKPELKPTFNEAEITVHSRG